ncbi:helix-turn-helix domain-containing protein [Neisseria animaloris]|uniref:helix-turn-helix domain-containing protein n=1 Tax=Neisseria animaloris TaxID=326522 RepID=UPI000D2F848A|nr:helix-turn-helix domain-containing protein [Neisseria animaloris]
MKPVKELTKPRNARQLVWDALRANCQNWHTIDELAEETGVQYQTVYVYLSSLFKGGYVAKQQGTRFSYREKYRLQRDAGVEAPRLRRDGTACNGTATEAMWRTMKILKHFDLDSLIAHVQMTHKLTRGTAKQYTHTLEQAGYLINTGSARYKQFSLVRNTGAQAPQRMDVTELYDPNLKQIMLREVPDYE